MAQGQSKCPHCGCTKVFQSRRGNARLTLVLRLWLVCARCYTCGHRYYRLRTPFGRIPMPHESGPAARAA